MCVIYYIHLCALYVIQYTRVCHMYYMINVCVHYMCINVLYVQYVQRTKQQVGICVRCLPLGVSVLSAPGLTHGRCHSV